MTTADLTNSVMHQAVPKGLKSGIQAIRILKIAHVVPGIAVLVVLLALRVVAEEIVVYDFANGTGDPGNDAVCDSIAASLYDYFTSKRVPSVRIVGPPDTARIPKPGTAVLYGSLMRKGVRTILLAGMQIGMEKISKELTYDFDDSVERNVSPAIDALFMTFEKKNYSNVQIFTDPDSALIVLDGQSIGVSPWESSMSLGRHGLRITKEGFKPLIDSIFVSASDNKFKFVLAPVAPEFVNVKLDMQSKRRLAHLSLGGAVVFGGVGIVSHGVLASAGRKYQQAGLERDAYDSYYTSRVNSLYVRNSALILAGVCTAVGLFYLYLINGLA